ncbi:MAG: DEAD/DEAH box helicase, partial [Sphingomonadales bacterium]
LFFSATMPPPIKKLTDAFLDDPKFIEVASPTRTAETIAQNFVKVARRDKPKVLKKLLSNKDVTSAIIFCNRKKDVTAVYKDLKAARFNARELHGDMDQSSRLEVLGMFKDGTVDYLIASDVAARGLDIKDVSHIINYDVPMAVEDYIHRIGRTGRAGKKGNAIMLLDNKDREMFEKIERLARVKILPLGEAKPEAKSEAPPAKVKPSVKRPEQKVRHQKPAAKPHEKRDAKPHEKRDSKPHEKRDAKKPQDKKPQDKKPRRHAHGVQEMEDHAGPGMGGHVPAFMMPPPNKK